MFAQMKHLLDFRATDCLQEWSPARDVDSQGDSFISDSQNPSAKVEPTEVRESKGKDAGTLASGNAGSGSAVADVGLQHQPSAVGASSQAAPKRILKQGQDRNTVRLTWST